MHMCICFYVLLMLCQSIRQEKINKTTSVPLHLDYSAIELIIIIKQ